MGASSVEKQIDNYLSLLSLSEKKTVLNLVKTIIKAKDEYDNLWNNEAFVKEMEGRTKSYENGTAKLYKFEEMKKGAIANYEEKKGRNK
jgi:hypothetical protein